MPVHWYVGVTGSGKTTRALADLAEDIARNKCPALVIDSQGVKLLAGIRHVDTWQKCALRVFDKRQNCAFIPKTTEEVGALFSVARELGDVNILLDEAAFFLSSRSIPKPIERALRTHFHWGGGKGGTVRLTTQSLADISPVGIQCTTSIKAFRCSSARVLQRLREEWGYNADEVERLERGEFIEKGMGF